jgi:hypothetical protein
MVQKCKYINKNWLVILVLLANCMACNSVKYTPRTKKQKFQELPSIILLDRIVEFRNEFLSWPTSKEDMVKRNKKYADAWVGFKFKGYSFISNDAEKLTFNFWSHPKDEPKNIYDKRIELNSYNGWVKFYRDGDIFVWKINKN